MGKNWKNREKMGKQEKNRKIRGNGKLEKTRKCSKEAKMG